jgi:signal transduction histidine kinase
MQLANANILEISGEEQYKTKNYFSYKLDVKDNFDYKRFNEKEWKIDKKSFNTFENRKNAYWARLKLKNNSSQTLNYYLKSENQFTYHIEFYLLKNNQLIKHLEDGVISKNKNREFNTNHMLFPIKIQANEELEVLFKIQNYNKIDLDFSLVTKDYLIDYYQTYNIIEGIFFGGMLLMMLYNLFLYFLLKFKAYLYYVLYVFWLSVYFIGLFGFSQRYFENFTWIFYISSGAFFITLTLFVQSILNLKEKVPTINKLLHIFIAYFFIATLTNIYVLETKEFYFAQILFNLFFIVVPLFLALIIATTYYLAYYRNDTISKFYSIIWTLIALIGLLLPLEYLNIFTLDIPSDYIFQFLTLFEVLCFSFILSYKIKLIEQEKKEQEKFLVQQNKLASMGEMISVIAHQWRQPLSEINGVILNMDLDYRKKRLNAELFGNYLDNIEMTTSYMSNTINDFMDFFKQNKRLEKLIISDVISAALKLVNISNKDNVEIQYMKETDIEFDSYKSELIQALLIVINNAIDAKASLIILKTSTEKNNLVISINDNGTGISNEIIDKIYNPYFTTKHESKGTGLGLYILKMIIEQTMNGTIKISSSNSGTKCNISIPFKSE